MASFTYATLTSALQAWLEDDGTEFSAQTDQIISLGEEKLLKDLDPLVARKIATGSTGTSATFAHGATDLVYARWLSVTTSGTTNLILRKKSDSFLREYWPDPAVTGTPKYWSWTDNATIRLAPTPATSLAFELAHTYRPTGLSSGNTTTWLGTNAGTSLLWACLLNSSQFLKLDPADQAVWEKNYMDALASSIREQRAMQLRDNSQLGDAN